MSRITRNGLQLVVDRINTITKSPMQAYVNGIPQEGCFCLDNAYNGYSLHRMQGNSGEQDVLQCGYLKPSELLPIMYAWIRGYNFAKDNIL